MAYKNVNKKKNIVFHKEEKNAQKRKKADEKRTLKFTFKKHNKIRELRLLIFGLFSLV